MSKKMFFHGRNGGGFWAFDAAVGIFLKYLIDAAVNYTEREDAEWLRACIDQWRIEGILLSNVGLHFESDWSSKELSVILRLIDETCVALERTRSISAGEMQPWNILDDRGVFARGYDPFPMAPVVELGRAIQAQLSGTLPDPPERMTWFFGAPDGTRTIEQRG